MEKTRTMGKFTVKSKTNPQFIYTGYSKQCEVAFRDYMSWCGKDKAPKAIQAEFDSNKGLKIEDIFTLTIEPLTKEVFEAATGKSVETNRTTKAKVSIAPETTEQKIERLNALLTEVVTEIEKDPAVSDSKVVGVGLIQKICEITGLTPEECFPVEVDPTEHQIYEDYKSGTPKNEIYDTYAINKKKLDEIVKKFEALAA